tara:strand:- start:2886 stop:3320 length:435 start_codon:yes stop_codon:yes gene_type:complete
MAFSQEVKELIFNAFQDHAVCLLATVDAEGQPNISPKGSMIVYDDEHLAYWERSKKNALKNLRENPKVTVIYSNKRAFFAKEIPFVGGIIRFYGTAEIHEEGELRDKVFTMISKREQEHDGADEGFAVLIKLDRAVTMRGESVM